MTPRAVRFLETPRRGALASLTWIASLCTAGLACGSSPGGSRGADDGSADGASLQRDAGADARMDAVARTDAVDSTACSGAPRVTKTGLLAGIGFPQALVAQGVAGGYAVASCKTGSAEASLELTTVSAEAEIASGPFVAATNELCEPSGLPGSSFVYLAPSGTSYALTYVQWNGKAADYEPALVVIGASGTALGTVLHGPLDNPSAYSAVWDGHQFVTNLPAPQDTAITIERLSATGSVLGTTDLSNPCQGSASRLIWNGTNVAYACHDLQAGAPSTPTPVQLAFMTADLSSETLATVGSVAQLGSGPFGGENSAPPLLFLDGSGYVLVQPSPADGSLFVWSLDATGYVSSSAQIAQAIPAFDLVWDGEAVAVLAPSSEGDAQTSGLALTRFDRTGQTLGNPVTILPAGGAGAAPSVGRVAWDGRRYAVAWGVDDLSAAGSTSFAIVEACP